MEQKRDHRPKKNNNKVQKQQGGARAQYPKEKEILPFRFDSSSGKWVQQSNSKEHITFNEEHHRFKVVTFNVLFDLFEADRIFTEKRVPLLLEILRSTDADLIALQEVRPSFLLQLQNTDWVKQNYFISDVAKSEDEWTEDEKRRLDNQSGRGITLNHSISPYGQILLSKWPISRLELFSIAFGKDFLLAYFNVNVNSNMTSFCVPVVHLTSDRSANPEEKRAKQLQSMFIKMKTSSEHSVLLGDFNFGDGEEDSKVNWKGCTDVWRELYPYHMDDGTNEQLINGFTYDPAINTMAAVTTHSNVSRRLDRVIVSSPTRSLAVNTGSVSTSKAINILEPISIKMIGTESTKIEYETEGEIRETMIHPSDHYGLMCEINVKI